VSLVHFFDLQTAFSQCEPGLKLLLCEFFRRVGFDLGFSVIGVGVGFNGGLLVFPIMLPDVFKNFLQEIGRSLREDTLGVEPETFSIVALEFKEPFLLKVFEVGAAIVMLPRVSAAIKLLRPYWRISSSTAFKFSSFKSVKNLRKNLVHKV